MCAKRGLGRGLDALLQGFDDDLGAPEVALIPVGQIRANPNQPRRTFDEDALRDLASSIKASGVLQPILVRPIQDETYQYELVAGERRWRASKLAERPDIPALVRELEDEESLAIALVENLQREDLNPMEEAVGLKHLQEEYSLTQESLAERVGKSRPAIANMLRLIQLPEGIQDDIRCGRLSAGHGRSLLAVDDSQAQETMRQHLLTGKASVREAEAMAAYWKRTKTLPLDDLPKPKPAPKASPKPLRPLPQELVDVQESLQSLLGAAVDLKGDTGKGRIVISYDSLAELNAVLKVMGASEVETGADDASGYLEEMV